MNYELKDVDHDGPIAVKRIEFEDGQWWDVLVEIPHGVQSSIRKAASVNMGDVLQGGVLDRKSVSSEQMISTIEESNMLRLTGCTVAWSWEFPVTRDSVNSLSPRHTKIATNVMSKLHVSEGAATRDEKKTDTSHSLKDSHSLNGGSTPVSTSASSNSA